MMLNKRRKTMTIVLVSLIKGNVVETVATASMIMIMRRVAEIEMTTKGLSGMILVHSIHMANIRILGESAIAT
jgi:hypothetical protein